VARIKSADRAGGLQDLKKAMAMTPNDAGLHERIARAMLGDGFYREALPVYDFLVRVDPKKADYYIDRGVVKQHLDDYSGALADYNKAIALDSLSGKAYYNRGNARLELNDYDNALKDVKKALLINENDDEAYFIRGKIHMALKDPKAAVLDYNSASFINVKNTKVLAYRGYAESFIPEYAARMSADFAEAVRLEPNSAYVYDLRGQAAVNLKNFNGAMQDYNKAITLPQDYSAGNGVICLT